MNKIKCTLTALLLSTIAVKAQTVETPKVDHSYKPLTLKLNEMGSKFLRIMTWNQMWISNTQNNPGTLNLNGQTQSSSTDIAIRRTRMILQAQISPRFLILTHFGINNQGFSNGGAAGTQAGTTTNSVYNNGSSATGSGGKRPEVYIHEAYTEYAVVSGKLHLGAGLHYWNGVTRLASASTANMMTLDLPIHNWQSLETTDQFGFQMGMYAKGQLGKLDYRVSLNKPFAYGALNNAAIVSPNATNVISETWATQGYLNYQIWDKESNVLPYFAGTYLGSKKVFNIGAGWYNQSNVTAARATTADSVKSYAQTNLGVDVFVDMPLKNTKGMALSVYSSFTNSNFGPNYLRNIGVLNQNPGLQTVAQNADKSWAGAGNAQPTIGTGNIWYTQAGVLLPKLENGTAFMPYLTYTYKNFDLIGKASGQYDAGVNYFINGHNAKVTLQYGNRPVYKMPAAGTTNPIRNGSAGEVILQTQIFL